MLSCTIVEGLDGCGVSENSDESARGKSLPVPWLKRSWVVLCQIYLTRRVAHGYFAAILRFEERSTNKLTLGII